MALLTSTFLAVLAVILCFHGAASARVLQDHKSFDNQGRHDQGHGHQNLWDASPFNQQGNPSWPQDNTQSQRFSMPSTSQSTSSSFPSGQSQSSGWDKSSDFTKTQGWGSSPSFPDMPTTASSSDMRTTTSSPDMPTTTSSGFQDFPALPDLSQGESASGGSTNGSSGSGSSTSNAFDGSTGSNTGDTIDSTAGDSTTGGTTGGTASGSVSQQMLSLHNTLRAKHQVGPLTWSSQMESAAQAWADKCVFQHSNSPHVGENIAWGYLDVHQAVQAWYDESKGYNYQTNGYSSSAGHFTQIVWKSTSQLGCGYAASCKYFVCQYSPAGNSDQYTSNVFPPTS